MPVEVMKAFEREFERAKAGLEEAKAAVLDRYDTVQADVVQTFLRLADDSARRLEATGQPVPEGFREAVVRGVLDAMPSREKLLLSVEAGRRYGTTTPPGASFSTAFRTARTNGPSTGETARRSHGSSRPSSEPGASARRNASQTRSDVSFFNTSTNVSAARSSPIGVAAAADRSAMCSSISPALNRSATHSRSARIFSNSFQAWAASQCCAAWRSAYCKGMPSLVRHCMQLSASKRCCLVFSVAERRSRTYS